MRRALVLGSRGFLGQHLVRRLRERGVDVVGGVRALRGTRAMDDADGVPEIECDVLDGASVAAAVADVAPTEVYHLVAWMGADDPLANLGLNLQATAHVLGAVASHARSARVLIPGSAAEYGAVDPERFPVSETLPPAPLTLYGVGKVAQATLAAQQARVHCVDVCWVRPFNVTGPGERPLTVCSQLARQVAAIEAGRQAPRLTTGTVETSRDFVDVRDVARALDLVMERGEAGVPYNICSGIETPIRAVVDVLRELGTSRWDVVTVPGGPRSDDVARQRGSYERLERATGWRPSIALRESLEALLESWRERLAAAHVSPSGDA
jgi:GDP-4-dehydro-6-deoxy-D-mannose reductase